MNLLTQPLVRRKALPPLLAILLLSCATDNGERFIKSTLVSTSLIEANLYITKYSTNDDPHVIASLESTIPKEGDHRPGLVLAGRDQLIIEHGSLNHVYEANSKSSFHFWANQFDHSLPFSAVFNRDNGESIAIGEVLLPPDFDIYSPSSHTGIDWTEEVSTFWGEPRNGEFIEVYVRLECYGTNLEYTYSTLLEDTGNWSFTISELDWTEKHNREISKISGNQQCELSLTLSRENSADIHPDFHSGTAIARQSRWETITVNTKSSL